MQQLVHLTKEQVATISSLLERHCSPVHVYQRELSSRSINVEFEFPFEYEIAPDGTRVRIVR